jgi:hypothetical protein
VFSMLHGGNVTPARIGNTSAENRPPFQQIRRRATYSPKPWFTGALRNCPQWEATGVSGYGYGYSNLTGAAIP